MKWFASGPANAVRTQSDLLREPIERPEEETSGESDRPLERMLRLRSQAETPSLPGDGLRFVREQSDIVDEAVRRLWRNAGETPSDGIALVAVGGYGRREMCPFSDVDLMVLHSRRRAGEARGIAEAVFYPFWDAGIEVGHAARSPSDCLRLARQDAACLTSLLDARCLAGDEELFGRLYASLLQLARKRQRHFVDDSLEAVKRRRALYGEGAYLLEPDLKDGWGGLRDIHQMLWAGKLLNAFGLSGLEEAGYLSARNARFLADAFDRLLSARVRLHLATGRKADRLLREYQSDVAASLGYLDSPEESGVERFMRDQHEIAARVHTASTLFWSRLVNGRTYHSRDTSSPGKIIQLLGRTARRGGELEPGVAETIQNAVESLPARLEWDDEMREGFLSLLEAGERGTKLLEFANDCDLISRCLPPWRQIRYRPASGAYHRFTIDMHGFRSVAEVVRASSMAGNDELSRRLSAEVEDRDSLLLAALLHDVGKGRADHAATGARETRDACVRAGIGDPDLVSFLVRDHLLLSETAARRDFSDEALLARLAEQIGSVSRLKMLYLLTAADSKATADGVWSEWRQAIVGELFFKLLGLLDPGTDAKSRRQTEREAAESEELFEVSSFIEQLPESYFTGPVANAVRDHFQLVRESVSLGLRTRIRPARMNGVTELSLAVSDTPGLLAKVAGVLALNGRNILSAETYSLSEGVALEIFLTTSYFERGPEDEDWPKVIGDLEKAIGGGIALDYRMAKKTRAYTKKSRCEPETMIDNTSSSSCTIVEVHAEDRMGLLFTIARALRDLDLDIRIAKVSTSGDKAVDVFYVVGADGKKVLDEERLEEIGRSVQYRLAL